MSRRNEPDEVVGRIAGDVGGCLLFALIGIVGFIVVAVIESFKVSPQEKLLKLQPPYLWDTFPEPIICSQCNQPNEFDAEMCFNCGALLTVIVPEEPEEPKEVTTEAVTAPSFSQKDWNALIWMILLLIALSIFACFFSVFCSWLAANNPNVTIG